MMFLKKFIFGVGAFFLILWGGAGTQSKNILFQGGGFIGLILGLVVLYMFLRMVWRAMGCLPSFLIFAGISLFILYAIGGFSNGVNHVGDNLQHFLGRKSEQQTTNQQMTDVQGVQRTEDKQEYVGNMMASLGEKFSAPHRRPQQSTLQNLPLIQSSAMVKKGNILKIKGYYFQLFGIDAPDLDQTCSGKDKRAYRCGRQAAGWLRDWIMDYELSCRIMRRDKRGNMIGVCSLGQYDLGAALVASGWALATDKIYAPYEEEARRSRNGLWSGTFYRPADWRKIKMQKPDIKIIKAKNPQKKGIWGF